jgi:hypothetical protein
MLPVITYVLGFASGWAARSIADSPQGVGVKLLEVAQTAKERLTHWVALERERFEDMWAEARSKAPAAAPTSNGQPAKENPATEAGRA